jgi:hypothetical protein
MKILSGYMAFFAGLLVLQSCKKDNYKEPQSVLSGHVVYKGEALQLERNQVPIVIYQYGFGKVGPINEGTAPTFAQDGSYSEVLFDGDYKIVVENGQGPFLWKQTAAGNPDTVNVSLRGSQTLDLEVTPYYLIRNTQITGGSGVVSATFSAEKIIKDANAKNIERVSLYVNKDQFVSGGDKFAWKDSTGAAVTDGVNITLKVPVSVSGQSYVYARVGLKIAGVEDLIYSPLQKVNY